MILALTLSPSGGTNELRLRPFAGLEHAVTHPWDAGLAANVLGNVALFVPFGGALAARLGGRPLLTVLAGVLLSVSIEAVQLAVPGRWTSTDDVLLNSGGAALGYLVWRVAGFGSARRSRTSGQDRPIRRSAP